MFATMVSGLRLALRTLQQYLPTEKNNRNRMHQKIRVLPIVHRAGLVEQRQLLTLAYTESLNQSCAV